MLSCSESAQPALNAQRHSTRAAAGGAVQRWPMPLDNHTLQKPTHTSHLQDAAAVAVAGSSRLCAIPLHG